jgi:PAS domain S-box-containing protein
MEHPLRNHPPSAIRHPLSEVEILIVEDSPTQAEQLREVLHSHGYHVTVAYNGQEALAAVRQHPPTLVITDIVMPQFDGFELCRQIKADPALRHLPVMLLTSLSDPADVIRGLECGADGFNVKPWEEPQLLSRIAQILTKPQLSEPASTPAAIEIDFVGQKFFVTADRLQILNLLLTTYETAVEKNAALARAQAELRALNEQLEAKVRARTAALEAEVAERKQAEERMAEQARILGLVPDAITLQDFDDVFSYWNQGAETLFGWTAAEAIGHKAADLFCTDPVRFIEAKQAVLRHGQWSGERTYVTKDRRKVTVASHWALARNPDQSRAILSISTDITEKKKTESLLLRSQRLDSVGRLASGIAHDLNNILAPMLIVPSILRGVVQDANALQMVNLIETNAQRGADIIKQLLIFGRGTEGQQVPVQLHLLVKDITAIIAETFPKNIQAAPVVPRDRWLVTGDPTQLHQILLNLCINARDAMPEGGRLTIKLENRELDELFAGRTPGARPGRYVCLSVADAGHGIAPEHLDKIYDPFFTTKEPGKGTGLGLSMVLGIVKSHRGFIQVQSQVGSGTEFQVFLPASEAVEAEPAKPANQPLPQGGGELVLVVDDEVALRQTIRKTLERNGYRTVEAANGAEGMTQYLAHQSDVRVVVTDLGMPTMDGATFIRKLRQLNPQLRIIAVSGEQSKSKLPAGLKVEAEARLSKPFAAVMLLETLQRVLHPEKAPAG